MLRMFRRILSYFSSFFVTKKNQQTVVVPDEGMNQLSLVVGDFYKYSNPLSMPAERFQAILAEEVGLNYGVSKQDLVQLIDLSLADINNQEYASIVMRLGELRLRLEACDHTKVLYNIIAAVYVHKDEVIYNKANGLGIFDESWFLKKIEILKKNKAIFQTLVHNYLTTYKEYTQQSASDFLQYSQEVENLVREMKTEMMKEPSKEKEKQTTQQQRPKQGGMPHTKRR